MLANLKNKVAFLNWAFATELNTDRLKIEHKHSTTTTITLSSFYLYAYIAITTPYSSKILLMLNNNLTLTTMIVIHRHYDNRIETDYNKPTLVITELYHLTITITAAQPLPTKLLIQTFFFIIHAGSTGTTDEWTNCKVTTNSVTGAQSQHSRQTLIDVVPTPGKPKTTLKRNKNCEWKGRPRETKGTKGMKGTKGRGIAMKTYMNEKENQKKIIFYTFINIFSCLINIHSCFTSYNISCNILCNVPVDIRLRTQVSEKEIKCRLMVETRKEVHFMWQTSFTH